ncbi:MAG: peptidylprolyl isomerase [Halioglobus sp.]|nr:peptidylprolyl isomerase [Halioglobus sp.]
MSSTIGNNQVVSMHYTLTDNAGNVLDSSDEGAPLAYLHGAGNIIPGLEQALAGKAEGEQVQAVIAPEEAYGEPQPDLVQVLPKEAFQGVEQVEPGMRFQAESADGSTRQLTVTGVEGDEVTVDANHPLAGVELHFDVQVVGVRDATEEELEHGHVHD